MVRPAGRPCGQAGRRIGTTGKRVTAERRIGTTGTTWVTVSAAGDQRLMALLPGDGGGLKGGASAMTCGHCDLFSFRRIFARPPSRCVEAPGSPQTPVFPLRDFPQVAQIGLFGPPPGPQHWPPTDPTHTLAETPNPRSRPPQPPPVPTPLPMPLPLPAPSPRWRIRQVAGLN